MEKRHRRATLQVVSGYVRSPVIVSQTKAVSFIAVRAQKPASRGFNENIRLQRQF
jgi:hypothetical protein